LGLFLAPGGARAGFAIAVAMIALAYTLSGRYMGNSPWLFLTCPIAAIVLAFAAVQSAFIAVRDGAITWRGTKYPLEELRKKR
jgi:hypothetical protein